jgi:hypothetical protein
VEAGGGTPNKDTSFPICDCFHKYASAIGKGEIEKMAHGAQEILREIQPFTTNDDTLLVIHELDIFDKHRVLITTFLALSDLGFNFCYSRIAWLGRNGIPDRFELISGIDIVDIPTQDYKKMNCHLQLATDITFVEPQVVAGKPVLPTLKEMSEFVLRVVDRFGAFLV